MDREERGVPHAARLLRLEDPIDQAVLVPQRRRHRQDLGTLVDDQESSSRCTTR